MSHTTAIDTIIITDISALHSAVMEMQQNGINCKLVRNAVPHMFYEDQHGVCDYVLQMPGAYDIGFATRKEGGYIPVTDLWAGKVARVLGVPVTEHYTEEQAAIGKFAQPYTKHAIINAAVADGHTVEECFIDETGEVQLLLAS